MNNDELLSAALRYADLGYAVFPCHPGTKIPATQHGFLDATTDAEQIEQWWKATPSANVAISTARLVVVDVDGRENRWLVDRPDCAADLAGSPLSTTPSGGRHHWFRQPEGKGWRNTTGKLAEKVDTRANGGYVLVPPSVVNQASYCWAEQCHLDESPDRLAEPPQWLVIELDDIARRVVRNGGNLGATPTGDTTGNPIPEGQRNSALTSIAGTFRRVGMTEAEIATALKQVNIGRCRPPLPDLEVERIAASVARYEPDTVATALVEHHYEQDRTPRCEFPNPGPFPEHLMHVPGFIGDVIDYTLATSFRPQPVLALAGALALLGTLTGRKVCGDDGSRTNVYCLGICESGYGKDRIRTVNKEILLQAGAIELAGPEGLASHSGLVSAIEMQPSSLLQLDEIGKLLLTMKNPAKAPHLYNIATVLMKLYSSSASVFLGDGYADAKKNKAINQPNACVFATTVPESFYDGLTTESITDGFVSRLLVFEGSSELVDRQKPKNVAIPQNLIDVARWWFEFRPGGNLQSRNPDPVVIERTPEADAIMERFSDEADDNVRTFKKPLGTLWTRASEKASKLAILHACSKNHEKPIIDSISALWGCNLSRYMTSRMAYLANRHVSETPFEARRKKLLRLITDGGSSGITKSDLYRATRSMTTRERLEAIESLLSCGDITETATNPTGKSGRPTISYVALSQVSSAAS